MTQPAGRERWIAQRFRSATNRVQERLERLAGLRIDAAPAVAIGAAIGAGAAVVKGLLDMLIGGETGFIVLMGGVALAAWIGGLRGGPVAALVSGLLDAVFLVGAMRPSLVLEAAEGAQLILFVLGGVGISILLASLRTSRDRLAVALADVSSLAADLERRDARLELALAASGTGFWEWDVRGGTLTWSETIFRQHGLEFREPAPTFEAFLEMVHPEDRPRFREALEKALAGEALFNEETRLVWADGSVHVTHQVGRVFRDTSGEPIRVMVTSTDVTERRSLEMERDRLLSGQRRADMFREAFLDVLSHELRTPITTIFGLTKILTRPGRVSDQREQLDLVGDVAAESERLANLLDDLLVLTRVERGGFALETEPLELRRLLTRAIKREVDRLPGLRIESKVPPDLPIVAGEVTYVEQILRNVLSNAAKYTPAGTAVVVVATHEGDTVAIRILDSGPGIDPEAAKRVFEPFYRGPESAGRSTGRASDSSCARASSRRWAARSGHASGRRVAPSSASRSRCSPTTRRRVREPADPARSGGGAPPPVRPT